MLSIFINLLLAIHVVVSLLIIFVVLMQRPKNEGLGAAFGGGMTDNLFGAQTTNVLQNFTRWLGGIFFALTLLLSVLYAKQANLEAKSNITRQLLNAPKPPAAAATPAAMSEDKIKELIEGAVTKAKADASASPGASASPAALELAIPAPSAATPAASPTPVILLGPARVSIPGDADKKDAK
jgi:preprotein translocase subunit SecG